MFIVLKFRTTVSIAAIFSLFVAILERLFLRKYSPLLIWIAVFFSGCGAVWIIFDELPRGLLQFQFEKVEAMFLIGTIFYAFYAIMFPKLFH